MGRKLDIDLLVGTEEIAQRLRLADAHRVHDWRRRYADFPQPVLKLRQAIWYWPEVERWAKERGRLAADGEALARPADTTQRKR